MNYRTILLTTLCFFLLAPLTAQGTVERAKKRTERKANQRLDQKIDQEVDKVLNGLFNRKGKRADADGASVEKDSSGTEEVQAATNSVLALLGGGSDEFEPYENDHVFSLTMIITERKRSRVEESRIRLGTTTDRIAMVTENDGGEQAHMIFNTQTGKTTMITTDEAGKTQGFRLRMPRMGKLMDRTVEDVSDRLEITRTGERRNIDGYDCELIVVENTKDKTTTRSWITQDVGVDARDVFGSMASMMGGNDRQNAPVPPGLADIASGFPIQSTTVDGNTTYEMHITDLRADANIDRSLFSTGDVVIEDVGF